MKKIVCSIAIIFSLIVGCAQTQDYSSSETEELKPQGAYRLFATIDNAAPSARFHAYPMRGMNTETIIGRIPAGTKLEVFDTEEWIAGKGRAALKQAWYKVKYKGKIGWISYYVTTGITREPIKQEKE